MQRLWSVDEIFATLEKIGIGNLEDIIITCCEEIERHNTFNFEWSAALIGMSILPPSEPPLSTYLD